MAMLFYLMLGAVLYGIVADHSDRAADREMRKRQQAQAGLRLIETASDVQSSRSSGFVPK